MQSFYYYFMTKLVNWVFPIAILALNLSYLQPGNFVIITTILIFNQMHYIIFLYSNLIHFYV